MLSVCDASASNDSDFYISFRFSAPDCDRVFSAFQPEQDRIPDLAGTGVLCLLLLVQLELFPDPRRIPADELDFRAAAV